MRYILSYKDARIESLMNKVGELEKANEQLTSWIFELCDPDCPSDYKSVIAKEVFDLNEVWTTDTTR